MLGRTLQPDVVADVLLGVPVEHHDHVDPAEALDQDLRHIDAPPLVRGGGSRLARRRGSARLEAQVRRDQQLRVSHDAQNPLLIDRPSLDAVQRRPAAAIAPEGMLDLEGLDPCQEHGGACGDMGRGTVVHPSSSSVFFTSSVRSATTRLSRLFSRSRRTTWSAC